ncbi:MAG: glycerol-3-phosphate dehydrogenase/oxidase [Halobacteriovoraceae bacterium]|nr:glycerol-3-phosphate dehydrogenase/oxidase [Halobacteriovoraceae bacterium]
MQNRFSEIDNYYDVLIVGGGITGAGLLRDLSMHNMNCLLIDKFDFSSQTSQSSSKMLHGGIRYLENFDFKLVWEALHEKNLWLKLTPHLTEERPFYFPVYNNSKRPFWMLRIGFFLYDLLSGFKNSPHRILNPNEAINEVPGLKFDGLSGCGVYYDAVMDDAQLTLAVIFDALTHKNCQARNYTELFKVEVGEDFLNTCTIRDTLEGQEKTITCKYIIYALGPFTDIVLRKLYNSKTYHWPSKILPSGGTHIWIQDTSLEIENPMLLQTKDNRVVFVVPQKGKILVGTTERKIHGDFFNLKATDEEVEYLLKTVNEYFPNANLNRSDVLSSFAGVRPLVIDDSSATLGKTAREHKVFQINKNTFVIAGGKYTTFRVMAQGITRAIVNSVGGRYNSRLTESPLHRTCLYNSFSGHEITQELVFKIVEEEKVRTFEDLVYRRLSIPSKEHWPLFENFDDFFLRLLPELEKKILITKEDILNYTHY